MKVRKLTPSVLKKIIAEEKQKIRKPSKRKVSKPVSKKSKTNKMTLSEAVDEATKLALQEAKIIRALKKIRNKRNSIRKSVSKLSKR